jgi:hypothetical protein
MSATAHNMVKPTDEELLLIKEALEELERVGFTRIPELEAELNRESTTLLLKS